MRSPPPPPTKIVARQDIDDNTIRRMRIACRITKAKNIHLEYGILITCPPQQLLRESASVVCHTYIACHVEDIQSCARIGEPSNPQQKYFVTFLTE